MSDSIKKYKEMLEDGLIKPTTPAEEYQVWWAQNKDRILANDQLNHEMNYKLALVKHIKNNKL
jgi:hypothetical protein